MSRPLLPVSRESVGMPTYNCSKMPHSGAARLILLWNFAVLLAYMVFYNLDLVVQVGELPLAPIYVYIGFTFGAVFSPIAGVLTDIKFSRHKAVLHSSYAIIVKFSFMLIILCIFVLLQAFASEIFELPERNSYILLGVYIPILLFSVFYVIFIVNAFQFGMDQLHDSPTEDSVLFVHWYVWIYYACMCIVQISSNTLFYDFYDFDYLDGIRIAGLCLLGVVGITVFSLLAVSHYVFHHRKHLFLLEPAGVNPYKLVYKVTKFVYQHKVPLRRSAFTYCTEEMPSRMDVGKHKYGGPFNTKQVEDVKAFWGILKVVLSIGPAFLLQTSAHSILPAFAKHSNIFLSSTNREVHLEGVIRYILISNGLLSPLLVVICIPLYLCLIRSRIRHHVPGILKRMGLAVAIMFFSLICTFVMDLVVHMRNQDGIKCMFRMYAHSDHGPFISIKDFPTEPLYQNVYFFTSQHVLSAVANMLLDSAVLEFICSQSPYSMKGLLLGTFFSVKLFFQGSTFIFILALAATWNVHSLSCGSGFYLIIICVGLVTLIFYMGVAKRYRYRDTNEPTNEYRYAENYYSSCSS